MYKKRGFWIIFTLVIILSILFLVKYFPEVMTFINLDIQMDRNEALSKAEDLAQKFDLGPHDAEAAALFSNDNMTQIYIELEAGGVERFNQMIKGDLYKPYTWDVRLFTEGETNEVSFYFTPEGEPYGFNERLSETLERPSIDKKTAQHTAEDTAQQFWNIDITEYKLVEAKNSEAISGRIDHTFVYERPQKINEARYRLQITVSGNKVSKIIHYIKIPESFSRKYQEMRSANNTIAMIGQIGMILLYGIGGILIGIFLLMRKGWIRWKEAIIFAGIIAFLGVLASFNNLPMYWNWYDTALSKGSFIFSQIIQMLMSGLTDFILLALTFIAAEGLTRKAFPQHTNFWSIWKKGSANSTRTLGNTIAGYYVSVLSLVFIVTFYYITTKYLNWWNPASLAVSPNALATPLPWLSAIANAFHAGFWEEALFRAVPLAGAALIGDKFGKRNLFIGIALIIEAMIFGAGHANYAAQPAYARLVELIIPSLYFAFLYLRFGLFTAALMHFVFDAILMSMPIWVSSGSSVWISRILFLLLFLLPLIIVITRRLQEGKWVELKDKFKNLSWIAPERKLKKKILLPELKYQMKTSFLIGLVILAIFGFLFWITHGKINDATTPLDADKTQAIEIAKETLALQNIELDDQWKTLASPINSLSNADRLLWEQFGKKGFMDQQLNFLEPTHWNIRFIKVTGEVAERAEEYSFRIDGQGKVIGFRNSLPENREGADLSKEEATYIALEQLSSFFKLETNNLVEKSASPSKLPNRTDWYFTYSDTVNNKLEIGELRYSVKICGSKPMSALKFLFVPEDWSRDFESKTRTPQVISALMRTIYTLLLLGLTIFAIISWSKKQFNLVGFIIILGIGIISFLAFTINGFPNQIARFTTSQPWKNQITMIISSGIIKTLISVLFVSFIAGWITFGKNIKDNKKRRFIHAIAWGFIFLGIRSLVKFIAPQIQPIKTSVAATGTSLIILNDILSVVTTFLTRSAILLALFKALSLVHNSNKTGKKLTFPLILVVSLIYYGKSQLLLFNSSFITSWLTASILVAVLVYIAFKQLYRFDLSSVLIGSLILTIFPMIRWGILNNYPNQLLGVLLGSMLLIPITIVFKNFIKN